MIILSAIGMLAFVFWTFLASLALILTVLFRGPKSLQDKIIEYWSRGTINIFRIKAVAMGREILPQGGALFLFNHCSFLDIFLLQAQVPALRFGAKIELFSIPIFGRAMALAGVLPIARQQREKVFSVYQNAVGRVQQEGQQFALAPEGKRFLEEKLNPFKSGPFIFAIPPAKPLRPSVANPSKSSLWL